MNKGWIGHRKKKIVTIPLITPTPKLYREKVKDKQETRFLFVTTTRPLKTLHRHIQSVIEPAIGGPSSKKRS